MSKRRRLCVHSALAAFLGASSPALAVNDQAPPIGDWVLRGVITAGDPNTCAVAPTSRHWQTGNLSEFIAVNYRPVQKQFIFGADLPRRRPPPNNPMRMTVTIDSQVSFQLAVQDKDYDLFGGICQPEAGAEPCTDYFEGRLSQDQVDAISAAQKTISVSIDELGVRDVAFPAKKAGLALKLMTIACGAP